jgi:hypothetical protein
VNFYKLTNSLLYPTDPDTGEPLHHKFDNSGFFCSGHESAGNTVDKFNRFFWRMGMENGFPCAGHHEDKISIVNKTSVEREETAGSHLGWTSTAHKNYIT